MMSFFHARLEHRLAEFERRIKKLPMRGPKKLPLRGLRGRRLQLLKDFQPGRLYSFPSYFATDLPDDLPEELLEDHTDENHRRNSYN